MAIRILLLAVVACGYPATDAFRPGRSLRPDLILPPPIESDDSAVCADSEIARDKCTTWQQIGYCRRKARFYDYMRVYCKKSCNLCNVKAECKDDPHYSWMCPDWKKAGSCKIKTGTRVNYMRQFCKKTCGFCEENSDNKKKKEEEKPKLNPPECGKGKGGMNIQAGGGTAGANSWPWQITLNYYSRFFCAATLISKQWALTAAHCVESKADIPEEVSCKLGEHDRYVDEGKEIEVKASKIIVHPDYSESPLKNDIALIKFKLPIAYNDYIKPACLPSTGERPSIGQYCFASGWGRIRRRMGAAFRFLQEISMPVVACSKCKEANGFKIDTNSFCAGFAPTEAVSGCTGDSGGPLNCEDTSFVWKLHGIFSWGNGLCPTTAQYKVFTRVEAYRGWIDDQIAKN